jgi:ribonuclease T2
MLKTLKAMFLWAVIVFLSCVLFPTPSQALVPFQGQLTAIRTCEAFSSFKKGTNPGNVRLKQSASYQIVGKNNEPASHYLLEIANAAPAQRWVSVDCGTVDELADNQTPPPPSESSVVEKKDEFLLALSWQPAFCESKPDKKECKLLAQDPSRFEATHFSLHGLWPQPEGNFYCNVSKGDIDLDENKAWSKLPPIEEKLAPKTWQSLQVVMPGTLSNLHRHEWIKHGTCYPGTAEEYFSEAIALTNAFNESPLQPLVASKIGEKLAIKDIDDSLTSSFGSSTGDKVQVKCSNSLLSELFINLEGDITVTTPVSTLLSNAPSAKPEKVDSCLIDDARN